MGTRLRADLSDHLTLLGAVFNGNAAGPGPNDPQLRDRYGVNFRVNDPPLVIGEAQFLWNGKKGDPGLDGKFKLGAWRHFGDFTSEHFDVNSVSLADPAGSGVPANLSGDFGVYVVFEQKLYRVGNDDDRGIGNFARAAYSPPDRNLIDLYADAGLELMASAIVGNTINSDLQLPMPTCRLPRKRSTKIFVGSLVHPGRNGARKNCSPLSISMR